jgi:hypothetical protein
MTKKFLNMIDLHYELNHKVHLKPDISVFAVTAMNDDFIKKNY